MRKDLKLTSNFYLWEYFPEDLYNNLSDNILIGLLDIRIVLIDQWIRDYFNKPAVINNWKNKGKFVDSGFRSKNCTTGAEYSQHKFGRASDIKIKNIKSEDIRSVLRDNFNELYKYGLSTIEKDTPTWVHKDIRFVRGQSHLIEVPFL